MDKISNVTTPKNLLRRNISWTFLGNITYAAGQWLLLLILARLGTVEEVGQFTLAFAVTAPIFMFFDLQLKAIQATDTYGEYQFNEYLSLRLLTTASAIIVSLGIVGLAGYEGEVFAVFIFVTLLKVVESTADVYYGAFHRAEKMDLAAKSYIFRSIGLLITSGGIFAVTGKLWMSMCGGVSAALAVLYWYDIPSARIIIARERIASRPDGGLHKISHFRLLRLARVALPLGIAVALVSLNSNISRYLVEMWHGSEALGYFGAIAYLGVGASRIISAVTQSLRPRLAQLLVVSRHEFAILLRRSAIALLFVAILGIFTSSLFGEYLLAVIYGVEYSVYSTTLVWIAVALLFQWTSAVVSVALQTLHDYKSTAVAAVAELIAAVLFGAVLVSKFGIVGAGATVALASMARMTCMYLRFRSCWSQSQASFEREIHES